MNPHLRNDLGRATTREALERADRHRLARSARTSGYSEAHPSVFARVAASASRALRHAPATESAEPATAPATPAGPTIAVASDGVPADVVIDLKEDTSIDPAGIDKLVEGALDLNGRPVRFRKPEAEAGEEAESTELHDVASRDDQPR